MIVLLDAGPLGLVTNPRANHESLRCKQWLVDLLSQGAQILVPEITDYEVRRELIRAGRAHGVTHLDQLKATSGYLPITTDAMLLAAELWAQARRQGQPTAPDLALDADVILAAQAKLLAQQQPEPVVIATTNVGHLARYVPARLWREITSTTP
jgi:predicted nucleic acid-binding protein